MKIIDEILKNDQQDDADCRATNTRNPTINYTKGCFLKISFTPDDWKLIKTVNLELEVTTFFFIKHGFMLINLCSLAFCTAYQTNGR